MKLGCTVTAVPAVDAIDIPALKERYRLEREKRLRPEGGEQYARSDQGAFADVYQHDPYLPVLPREPIAEDLEVAVLGAGFSGLLAGVHLRNAGVTDVRHLDHAGDFGGVWYWNRYPGVQCDNDALCYLPLLEETGYMPSRKFTDGVENQAHAQRIGRQYGLYDRALFHTLITGIHWDEDICRWRIETNRGDNIRARYVIMCGGPLNRPKLPGIPGIGQFRGELFHTARWNYDYTGGDWRNPALTKLADKTVAILGTGATGVQAIPYLARYAKKLYVMQRTPSTVDTRPNPPIDPEWFGSQAPGWQAQRQANFQHGAIEGLRPAEPDLICDIWTEILRNLRAEFDVRGDPQSIAEFLAERETMDYRVMERMRARVDALIDDPATAEKLKPWFRYYCKRPCSNDDYYPSFNRKNVELIDVSASRGVERMTEHGFVHDGVEHPIDLLICASGFEVTTDLDRRWGIGRVEGKGGLSLYRHWAEEYRTLHGTATTGFPNMFFTGYLQGGFNATTTLQFERQGYHIAHIIAAAARRGAEVLEVCKDAEDKWVRSLREVAIDISELQRECTPTYFNNDGAPKSRWYLGESWGPGWEAFEALVQQWRDSDDLAGFDIS